MFSKKTHWIFPHRFLAEEVLEDVLTEEALDDVLTEDRLYKDVLGCNVLADDELAEDGLGVVLGEGVLGKVLPGEDLVDVPAEDALVPHPQSDMHVRCLRVVLGDDQANVLPLLYCTHTQGLLYSPSQTKKIWPLYSCNLHL